MAGAYQHASDYIPDHSPFSGVITAAGKWVAVQAESQDWVDYQTWAATEGNVPDPYLHPANGGVAIVLEEGQVAYGSMLDSILEADGGNPTPAFPPKNVDVPAVQPTTASVGDTLTCTLGNWEGSPSLYNGLWMRDDESTGVYGSEYLVTEEDVGHTMTCVVTAISNAGQTTAPPSNGVAISAPAAEGATVEGVAVERSVPRHDNHRSRRDRE